MASSRMFVTATSVVCFLSLFQKVGATEITNRDVSSLLSLLNRKITGNKKPVIIILEKDSGQSLKNKPDQLSSSDEHDENNIPHFLHDKLQLTKNKVIKKSTPSYLNLLQYGQKNRQRYVPKKTRFIADQDRTFDKRVLRSPIVKKLLRISNSLRCDAKDDCQDKCQKKYKGKKTMTCQVQCEVKFECVEQEDPCESGCEDSCGGSNECTMMSTQGEKLVPKKNNCNRC